MIASNSLLEAARRTLAVQKTVRGNSLLHSVDFLKVLKKFGKSQTPKHRKGR